ncbi:TraB/GumN family protein [Altererythrobacter sp. RZ02]|uniref:TraB/GumN family protein n=1 Tax=Pontixanthobacter rizhaonensis TaxID=2730337 RepID=A0A848QCM7_9SPHN|nr:TraB/GumN family protein [Pontixanthobacter rizhaonensis]NMW31361.1 TraB/GumN family protein [Pontixanthobacter rizhaonensis]
MNTYKNALASTAAGIAMLFSTTACAQQQQKPTPVASTEVAIEDAKPAGPALWKVADEDTTIYLFGTVHLLPEGIDWYTPKVANALAASDKLVTEIHMEKGSEAAAGQYMMGEGSFTDGRKVRDLLNEEQKAAYEAALGKLGVPAPAFDGFEPWFVAMNMSIIPLLQKGYSPDAGVESALEEKAGDMARGELETVAFQTSVFDGLPMNVQVNYMMEVATNIDDVVPMLDKMVDEWAEGDADALAELMNEGLSDPVLAEALLYNRNANWTDWIDNRMDTPGTVFIAVGAGHLAGEKSVQDMLEDRDIEVTRVQ